nr:amidohydrolase family protein [Sciscionella marina]
MLGPGSAPCRPLRNGAQRRAAILRAGELLSALGITSYTEPGLGPGENDGPSGAFGDSVVEQYRTLAAQGLLRARVNILSLYGELDGPSGLPGFLAGLAGMPDGADQCGLRFGGVKIFADGIPQTRSAYTRHRYLMGGHGTLLVDGTDDAAREQDLGAMIEAAHLAGQQIGVHATGDRGVQVVLDAIERASLRRTGEFGHHIVHGDLAEPAQLRRMAALGVGLAMQPGLALHTRAGVESVLGTEVARSAWPLGAALREGVRLCLSSDAPVLSPDWRVQLAAADELLGPTEDPRRRMARLLRCYTVEPARLDGAAGWKGTLLPGMAADLCVLAQDPFTVPAAGLPEVEVDLTVLGGRIVYRRG